MLSTLLCSRALHARSDRRGGVLVLALVSVMVVVAFAASFLQVSSLSARRQTTAVDAKRAFYLADAGLAESYRGLTIGKTGNLGSEAQPAAFGDGLLWVDAADSGKSAVRLDSTAMVGSSRVVLSIVAEPGEESTSALAVFTAEDLTIAPGSRIDSYDSRDGPYADQKGEDVLLEGVVKVGSNGVVALEGTAALPTIVHGDVEAGPAERVTATEDVYLAGETGAALAASVLPPVDLPGLAKIAGTLYTGAIPLVVPAGEYGVDFLHVGADSEVVLQGPTTLQLGGLHLATGAQLTVDTTDGGVELYVEDYLTLQRGSLLTNTGGDPGLFVLQFSGTAPATLKQLGPLYAVVYAPAAEVLLGGGAEVFGSLVAGSLAFDGSAALHFDRALLDRAADLATPKVLTWRIVDLGQTGGGTADPFAFLGVDPAACPPPAQAHGDQLLELDYVDGGGTAQSYSGPESAFDWTDVESVGSFRRDGKVVSAAARNSAADQAQAALPPHVKSTLDFLETLPGSAPARAHLLAGSPLHAEVLATILRENTSLTASDLKDVLLANSPFDPRLQSLVIDSTILAGPDQRIVLEAQ